MKNGKETNLLLTVNLEKLLLWHNVQKKEMGQIMKNSPSGKPNPNQP